MTTNREANAERRRLHDQKWRAAQRQRDRWTAADFAEEARQLEAEIAARVAAGQVTRCPPLWAKGATGPSIFTDS